MSTSDQSLFASLGTLRPVVTQSTLKPYALPHAALYYSLYGEDAALRALFKERLQAKVPGIYVDIGCAGAFSGSNTAFFYSIGWRGMCVDANSFWSEEYRIGRPEDVFVNTAVGENPGSVPFYRNTKNFGMSMISDTSPGADYTGPTDVKLCRLDQLLAEHIGDKAIQFMTLDVEGAELGVLKSNDWKKWRPEVVLMECHGFSFDQPYADPTVRFLADQGYRLDSKIGPNVLMTA